MKLVATPAPGRLTSALALILAGFLALPATVFAQGHGGSGGHGMHGAGHGATGGRMGGGMGGDMGTIHALMDAHTAIDRRVEDVHGGVATWTESDDPDVAASIRQHVREMAARLEAGRPIRRWDPLFAEIFDHADSIEMRIEDTPRGVYVLETSTDPAVTLLIRQHAHRAVSEFVEQGMERMHEPTPMPEGYEAAR